MPSTISGNSVSVASPSRQSSEISSTAVPSSSTLFCTSEVTPSVTSCSSASMSFVRREISFPVRLCSK